jgi:dTDP-4-dehydrorhamnose 3,5-epimerase
VSSEPAGLEGVVLVPLEWRADDRGAFTELFRGSWMPGAPPMVQANLSRSKAGVLRGMHFHREQADFWVLLSGKQFVALFDLRSESPTNGQKTELLMDGSEQLRGLYVPPGVAHGFYAETEVELLYLVDRYYTGDDEHGFIWNDIDAGINWPNTDPILSERDRANPPLSDAKLLG